jgi:hypothetical protein
MYELFAIPPAGKSRSRRDEVTLFENLPHAPVSGEYLLFTSCLDRGHVEKNQAIG